MRSTQTLVEIYNRLHCQQSKKNGLIALKIDSNRGSCFGIVWAAIWQYPLWSKQVSTCFITCGLESGIFYRGKLRSKLHQLTKVRHYYWSRMDDIVVYWQCSPLLVGIMNYSTSIKHLSKPFLIIICAAKWCHFDYLKMPYITECFRYLWTTNGHLSSTSSNSFTSIHNSEITPWGLWKSPFWGHLIITPPHATNQKKL